MSPTANLQIFPFFAFLALISQGNCSTPDECKQLGNLKCTDLLGQCTKSLIDCQYFYSSSSTTKAPYQEDGALCKYDYDCLRCCNSNICSKCTFPSSDPMPVIVIIFCVIGGVFILLLCIYKIFRIRRRQFFMVQPINNNPNILQANPHLPIEIVQLHPHEQEQQYLAEKQQLPNHLVQEQNLYDQNIQIGLAVTHNEENE